MNLVLTISIGEQYEAVAQLTHSSIRAYANKIGAEFMVISEKRIATTTAHWEKFQIFDLLNKYERILYIDSDVIIRSDCPNLFDIVPSNKLGMFNEANFTDRSRELIIDCCKQYGVTLPGWDGRYFNSGVMVISRTHKYLFQKPELEYYSFYEQTYLNMKISEMVFRGSLEIHELEYRYNRMTCLDRYTGETRHASFIIHYAGCPNINFTKELIVKDLQIWKEDFSTGYKYTRNIFVTVSGGLGDQICAEPAIRFMKEHVYPRDNIVVATHFRTLFKHLDVEVVLHNEFKPKDDTPYFLTHTLPSPETITWSVVSNLLCHTIDYASIATMKRILPAKDKQVKLEVSEINFDRILPDTDLSQLILVHPGKHWQSKTLPVEYWQELIDKLSLTNKICVIGKDDSTRGTVDVKCPDGVIDLRNLLDLDSLIYLISEARLLVSNDSAPVHIAGAFDNWIVLFPTCKHPDHILPYRNGGDLYYKARALYKKLPIDEFNAEPTCIHGSSAEFILGKWADYLMPIDEVIEEIHKINW